MALSIAVLQAALSVTSQAKPRWASPGPLAAALAASPSRSRMMLRAPCLAKRRAVARPMPRCEAAPVMTQILSDKSMRSPPDQVEELQADPPPSPPFASAPDHALGTPHHSMKRCFPQGDFRCRSGANLLSRSAMIQAGPIDHSCSLPSSRCMHCSRASATDPRCLPQ